MNVEEIDNSIREIRETNIWNEDTLLKLMFLIEKKIQKYNYNYDLRHFSSIISDLKLNEEDARKLITLRNSAAHSKIDDKVINSAKEWIINEIIPTILNYQSREHFKKVTKFEEDIVRKLIELGDLLGFQAKREVMINSGKRRVDLLFVKDKVQVIFEIKFSASENVRLSGIQQLKMYLIHNNTRNGVLIIPGKENKILKDKKFNILVFGDDSDFNFLKKWLKKLT